MEFFKKKMALKICRTQSPTKANYKIEELIIKFHPIQEGEPAGNEMKVYYLQQDHGLQGEYHLQHVHLYNRIPFYHIARHLIA